MAEEPIKNQNSNEEMGEYFDDCPICQAMKKMKLKEKMLYDTGDPGVFENTTRVAKLDKEQLEELKEAFRKAKENGAMVGGEWFDEE